MRDAVQRCLDALGGRTDRLTLVRAAVDQALWDPGEIDLAQRYAVAHVAVECHRLVLGSDAGGLPYAGVMSGPARVVYLRRDLWRAADYRARLRAVEEQRAALDAEAAALRDECRQRWAARCPLATRGCDQCGIEDSGSAVGAVASERGEGGTGDGG